MYKPGRFFESKEYVDYGYVINNQLNRIAQIRSDLSKLVIAEDYVLDEYYNFKHYLNAVETLYTILLPQLRGNARKWIDLAVEVYDVVSKMKHYKKPDVIEYLKQILNENGLMQKLPREVINSIVIHPVFLPTRILDRAVEEMIKKLNEAGLLIRGKELTVGFVKR